MPILLDDIPDTKEETPLQKGVLLDDIPDTQPETPRKEFNILDVPFDQYMIARPETPVEAADRAGRVFDIATNHNIDLDEAKIVHGLLQRKETYPGQSLNVENELSKLPQFREPSQQGFYAAPESGAKNIFGYQAQAKPEAYYNLWSTPKKAAFDAYMFAHSILTRMAVGATEATGLQALLPKGELEKLTADEMVNKPAWYQKTPEYAGAISEQILELMATQYVATATGILSETLPKYHKAISAAEQTGILFGLQSLVSQEIKGGIEATTGNDAGYEGGTAILENMVAGGILSFGFSGAGRVWSLLKPTEQNAALKVLGLKGNATEEDITVAARNLLRKLHPDKMVGQSAEDIKVATEKFNDVLRARNSLLKNNGEFSDIITRKQKPKLLPTGEIVLPPETAKPPTMPVEAKVGVTPADIAPNATLPSAEAIKQPTPPVKAGKRKITPEQANQYRKENIIPDEWYVHGRAGGEELQTHTFVSKDWGVAEQYAGRKGSQWMIKPKPEANVLDFSDDNVRLRIAKDLKNAYENGELSLSLDEAISGKTSGQKELTIEQIADDLQPKNIVENGGWLDSWDFLKWLYENKGTDFVKTKDGGVVINNEAIETIKVPQPKSSFNPPATKEGGINAESDIKGQGKIKYSEGLNRPLKELGGMPEKPPGLTKDEMSYLGKREQSALKYAQAHGGKVGYKLGERHAYDIANSEIFKIRMAAKFGDEQKRAAHELVEAFVPKEYRYRYTRYILNVKNEAQVEKLADKLEKFIAQANHRLAVRELKNFIKGIKSDYRNGRTTFGALRSDVRKAFTDFLDKYDLSELSEGKAETLKSREEYTTRITGIKDLAGKIGDAFESFNFEEGMDKDATNIVQMGDARVEEIKRLSKTPISELEADDIREIQKNLEELIRVSELKGTIKYRDKSEKLRDQIRAGTKEVYQRTKVLGEVKRTFPTTRYLVNTGQATMDTLIGEATGKENSNVMDVLFDRREAGTQKSLGKYKEIIQHIKQKKADIAFTYEDCKELDKTIEVILGGDKVNLRMGKLAILYAHSRNAENLRELIKSKGLTIYRTQRDPKTGYLLKSEYVKRTGKITLREIKAAIDKLPDIYRRLVDDVMFDTNKKVAAPAINETSMELENYEVANAESNYVHIPREMESKVEGGVLDISTPPNKRGRAIARIGGKQRIILDDIESEIMGQAQFAAEYYGMTEPLRDARTMLANKDFREQMKQTGNEDILRQMETLFRRSQGIFVDKSILEKKMGQILRGYGQSVLSLRLSGGLVQLTSPPAAWGVIEPKYFIGVTPTPAAIETLKTRRPDLWYRWEGKAFDYVLGDIAAQHAFETMIFDKTPIPEKLLAHYTMGDEVSITSVWQAAEKKIAAETGLKPGTAEFNIEVDKLFDKAMRGQGQFDMLHRSDMTSNPNIFMKGSTLFMSTNNAFYNTLLKSLDDYHKGRANLGKTAEAIGGVITSMAAATTIRTLYVTAIALGVLEIAHLLGRKNDEETKAAAKLELKNRAKGLPLKIIYNMAGMSVFGQVFSSAVDAAIKSATKGYNQNRLSQIQTGNIFTDMGLNISEAGAFTTKAVAQYLTDDEYKSGAKKGELKWKDSAAMAADDIVGLVALRYGLPYGGPKSDMYYPSKGILTRKPESEPKTMTLAEYNKLFK